LAILGCANSDKPDSPSLYSISGVVPGVAGVTIRIANETLTRTVTTAADGTYSLTGLASGTYLIRPTQPGFTFEPVEAVITLEAADALVPPFARSKPAEALTEQQMGAIDSQPESHIVPAEIILPNGQSLSAYAQSRGITPAGSIKGASGNANHGSLRSTAQIPQATGPQQKKNDVVAQMVISAVDYACGRDPVPCTKWDFPADPTGTLASPKPAQKGLTYIWGGKFQNESVRSRGVDGCPEYTFGMDCSGLISKIASKAGLTPPDGSINQSDPVRWVIPSDWKLKFKRITNGAIQTGDLIGWPGHIGIAASDGRTDARVISSTGLPNDCAKNIITPRGPRTLTVSQLSAGLGAPTAILRLVTTLSGDWDLYIRCTNQNTDAAIIHFKIDNDQGGPFTATGEGTDYNGAPLSFLLEGTYDQNTNTINAKLSLRDGSRSDSFTKVLLEDDTGYFPMTKVINNGGCDGSVRLVRVQAGSSLREVDHATRSSWNGQVSSLFSPPRH
jgi:cell wall-associated NlpC family hydrolase